MMEDEGREHQATTEEEEEEEEEGFTFLQFLLTIWFGVPCLFGGCMAFFPR
jgi:hypothetical protein